MHEDAAPDHRGGTGAQGAAIPDGGRPNAPSTTRLPGQFLLLVAATYCLIVLGALVRANDAGLACPDWPLCFGEVIPRMNLKVAFEWGHRTVAGGIAILFAVLAVRALRRPGVTPVVRRLLALAASLLAVQIVLGALTVWLQLASWTVTAHLITGNCFAIAVLLVAHALRDFETGRPERAEAPAAVRAAVLASAALLFVQMVLGGLVASNYAGLACPEWPTCNGGLWFPSFRGSVGLHVIHRLNGYALFLALATTAFASRRQAPLARISAISVGFAVCEIAVGVANVRWGVPPEITGSHSALAAALALTVTLAVRDVLTRRPIPRR
jgi:cytochrome c oxidase assembly protein subunit 15